MSWQNNKNFLKSLSSYKQRPARAETILVVSCKLEAATCWQLLTVFKCSSIEMVTLGRHVHCDCIQLDLSTDVLDAVFCKYLVLT